MNVSTVRLYIYHWSKIKASNLIKSYLPIMIKKQLLENILIGMSFDFIGNV